MDTSDRQVAETGRNRELGLIPAMVMAVVATLSGAGVSFAPLYEVVPEFLRTLVFARPRGDDQFADCTFSPSLDMSR